MSAPPKLSVGLAVRNGGTLLGRCIESVLSQDFTDLELIVCDNRSDDGTIDLVEGYARADRRVKFAVNSVNVGSHENMNRVLAGASGTYYRWISADDWLEPGCLSTCVETLDQHAEAVGVTTDFTIHVAGGHSRFEQYRGEFPDSPDAARRFARMLWFFHAGDAKYDPVYGMYRRDALTRSHRIRPIERTDWLLAAELALMGPIVHVHERLANRTRDYPVGAQRVALRKRLDPVLVNKLQTSSWRLSRELGSLTAAFDLTDEQRRHCRQALRSFLGKEVIRVNRARAADTKHQLLAAANRSRLAASAASS